MTISTTGFAGIICFIVIILAIIVKLIKKSEPIDLSWYEERKQKESEDYARQLKEAHEGNKLIADYLNLARKNELMEQTIQTSKKNQVPQEETIQSIPNLEESANRLGFTLGLCRWILPLILLITHSWWLAVVIWFVYPYAASIIASRFLESAINHSSNMHHDDSKQKMSDRTYWTIVVAVIFTICLWIYAANKKEQRIINRRSSFLESYNGSD